MAYELTWSEEALEDVDSIATYIEKDSLIYAKTVVSKFFEITDALLDFPKLGRVVPELNQENIRELFAYSYRLIYKFDDISIVVVAIIHGKMLLNESMLDTRLKV